MFAGMAVFALAVAVVLIASDAHAAAAIHSVLPVSDGVFSIANVLAVAGVSADLRGKRAKAVDDFDALVTKMNAEGLCRRRGRPEVL
jgi:hypothetical protein